jgi:hypothetical protein
MGSPGIAEIADIARYRRDRKQGQASHGMNHFRMKKA